MVLERLHILVRSGTVQAEKFFAIVTESPLELVVSKQLPHLTLSDCVACSCKFTISTKLASVKFVGRPAVHTLYTL